MTITGHREVTAILERELPPVALLAGPPSVGKWTLAQHLADHHRVAMVDRSLWPDGLVIDGARTIKKFVATAPMGTLKLVMARLDGSTVPALNALLKTLEEPPPRARFILTACAPTLPTIVSRAQVLRLGLLHDEELVDVLCAQGMSATAARKAAPLGRGQVKQALQAEAMLAAKAAVLTVAKALATHDAELYDRAFTSFDDQAGILMRAWLEEAITGQWRWFAEADTFGLRRDPARLRRMLVAVSQLAGARPRLGVRAALEPFLT